MTAYSTNYLLIDWSDFKPATVAKVKQPEGPSGPFFMKDIAEFVSPIDYSVISSRSQLREHEQRHQVRQVGSDLKPHEYAANKPVQLNERRLADAYRSALEKHNVRGD